MERSGSENRTDYLGADIAREIARRETFADHEAHGDGWVMAAGNMANGIGHRQETVSTNAKDTPSKPMPTCGKAGASTALPHPPNTNQNVPMLSASNRFVLGIIFF